MVGVYICEPNEQEVESAATQALDIKYTVNCVHCQNILHL